MKTPLQMCADMKERLQLPDSSEALLDALTPRGEMYPLMNAYLAVFGSEVLPRDVPNPVKGDLRWRDGQEVWTGGEWLRRV